MTTPITDLNRKECELIPAAKIAAYTDIRLDPENPTGIILDTSWDEIHLDIRSIVKAGETVTRLYLAPEEAPTVLKFEREDGEVDCIIGDELSRIISMRYLKDVDQAEAPSDGIVYQFDENTRMFEPFNLKAFVANTNATIGRLQAAITNLQNRLEDEIARAKEAEAGLDSRLTTVEEKLTPPTNAPASVKVAFGNINAYGDITNTNNHSHGIYTHDPNTNVTNDLYFS